MKNLYTPETRREARDSESPLYLPRDPCKRGHRSARYTSSGGCFKCSGAKTLKTNFYQEQFPELDLFSLLVRPERVTDLFVLAAKLNNRRFPEWPPEVFVIDAARRKGTGGYVRVKFPAHRGDFRELRRFARPEVEDFDAGYVPYVRPAHLTAPASTEPAIEDKAKSYAALLAYGEAFKAAGIPPGVVPPKGLKPSELAHWYRNVYLPDIATGKPSWYHLRNESGAPAAVMLGEPLPTTPLPPWLAPVPPTEEELLAAQLKALGY